MSSEHVCTVRLPCYEGFNQFAIWPAPESVSNSVDYIQYLDIDNISSHKLGFLTKK